MVVEVMPGRVNENVADVGKTSLVSAFPEIDIVDRYYGSITIEESDLLKARAVCEAAQAHGNWNGKR